VLLLLRVATGDNWMNIFLDCIPQEGCIATRSMTCGTYAAIPFFVSFSLLVRADKQARCTKKAY
jgi:hypothetical protein